MKYMLSTPDCWSSKNTYVLGKKFKEIKNERHFKVKALFPNLCNYQDEMAHTYSIKIIKGKKPDLNDHGTYEGMHVGSGVVQCCTHTHTLQSIQYWYYSFTLNCINEVIFIQSIEACLRVQLWLSSGKSWIDIKQYTWITHIWLCYIFNKCYD